MTYIEHNLKELLHDKLPVETDVYYLVDKLMEQCYFETSNRKGYKKKHSFSMKRV